ncbi:MAG: outer membrane beta-barrel protein [Treponema sp.]|nr:outer membrane beta-barrel protein [Treponema sp.]
MAEKKHLLFLLILAMGFCASHLATAEEQFSLNAGIGGDFSVLFDVEKNHNTFAPQIMPVGGVSVFFDATYVEVTVAMVWGSKMTFVYPYDPAGISFSLNHIGFSLYGKYPFVLKKLTIYPMLGVDYHVLLSAQVKDAEDNDSGGKIKRGDSIGGGYKVEDQFDYLSLGLGVGLDVPLPKSFFIRSEFILHYVFDSTIASDRREYAKKFDYDYSSIIFGPQVKFAVGYRF